MKIRNSTAIALSALLPILFMLIIESLVSLNYLPQYSCLFSNEGFGGICGSNATLYRGPLFWAAVVSMALSLFLNIFKGLKRKQHKAMTTLKLSLFSFGASSLVMILFGTAVLQFLFPNLF